MARPKTKEAWQSNAEYVKKNYDTILLNMARGGKDQIRALADAEGVSVSRYILEAVEQRSGLKLTLDNALPWVQNSEKKK